MCGRPKPTPFIPDEMTVKTESEREKKGEKNFMRYRATEGRRKIESERKIDVIENNGGRGWKIHEKNRYQYGWGEKGSSLPRLNNGDHIRLNTNLQR